MPILSTLGPRPSTLDQRYGTFSQKGPLRSARARQESRGDGGEEREASDQDLVARQHRAARVRRPHLRRAQREQVHPGLRDREHGRPQARRVRPDASLPRPHRRGEGDRQEGGRSSDVGWTGRGVSDSGQGHGGGQMSERSRARAARHAAERKGVSSAIQRTTRQSPYKMRLVIDQIRGKDVNEALGLLKFSKKHAAVQIAKVLNSAVANAEFKSREGSEPVDVDTLYISHAIVNEGPALRRFMPAAQGRATPIRKRTSHVEIVLDAREEKKGRGKR